MNNLEEIIKIQDFNSDSLILIISNLILCIILLSILSWFYRKYSISLGGKTHVSSILTMIGLIVFLVITVIKSSLALSLGLVGALSIVRFRTPIKEPEELGYLFFAIAIGLGMGAGYKLVTLTVSVAILIYLYVASNKKKGSKIDGEYSLVVTLKNKDKANTDKIIKIIEENVLSFKINRYESSEEQTTIYMRIILTDNFDPNIFQDKINILDQKAEINIIESSINW